MQKSKFKISFFITLTIVIVSITIISSRVYATGGVLKPGWNIVSWPGEWGSGIKYSALPAGCDQLSVRKNGWFEPWVRDYSADGTFEAGRNYYVRCGSEVGWSF